MASLTKTRGIVWAITGFAFALAGGAIADGSILPLVAIGGLGVGTVTALSVVNQAIDWLGPLSARLLKRLSSLMVLLLSDIVQFAACASAALLILLNGVSLWLVLSFAVVNSAACLLADMADEVFSEEISGGDERVLARFNSITY